MVSQASQSSTWNFQGKKLSQDDLQTLVNDIVVFILSRNHNKHPIKRQDVVKNCLREFGKSFKIVMDEAKLALKQVYGMDLLELGVNTNNKQYMLINSPEMASLVEDMMLSDEVKAQQIFLLLVLSNIFMNGGVVREDHMLKFLTDVGVIGARKIHEYFGDVKKLLTVEFVRQMYLEYSRIPDSDPPKYEFRWGQRAKVEVSHYEILKFVTKMYGSDNMKIWTTQYKEMVKAEAKKGHFVNGELCDESIDVDDDD